MKIISVFRHAESCIGANEAGHIEGEGSVVCEGFANEGKVTVFSTFYKATGPDKAIEAGPLHALYLSLEVRTCSFFMGYTSSKFCDLVLKA